MHPLFGPWVAGGSAQSVYKPQITIGPQPGSAQDVEGNDDMSTLRIRAVLLDEVVSVGAIQRQVADQLDFTCYGHVTMAERKQMKDGVAISTPAEPTSDEVFYAGVVQHQESSKDLAKDYDTARYTLARVLTAGTDVNGRRNIDISPDELFRIVPSSTEGIDLFAQPIDSRLADFIQSSANIRIAGKPLVEYFSSQASLPRSAATTTPRASPKLNDARLKQSMSAKVWGRRLAISKANGFMCLVPMATQPGDQIWVVPGHPRPVILRQIIDVDPCMKYCRLVGEAYVDGIMEGEIEGLGVLSRYGSVVLF
ncbi:WD repeat-containing protein 55 [Microdochium nivale]|nr:WD repeat-containing protein 55 [Microdochium nivale]